MLAVARMSNDLFINYWTKIIELIYSFVYLLNYHIKLQSDRKWKAADEDLIAKISKDLAVYGRIGD